MFRHHETEEIEIVLQIFPDESGMGTQKALEELMNVIYRLKRILRILQSLRFCCGMDLFRKP